MFGHFEALELNSASVCLALFDACPAARTQADRTDASGQALDKA
jgi:hypothetical protein